MISYNTVPHGLGPAVRSIRPCHSNVVSPRDVTICASSGEPSPLDELPASLAKRFRNARNQKRSRSSKVCHLAVGEVVYGVAFLLPQEVISA